MRLSRRTFLASTAAALVAPRANAGGFTPLRAAKGTAQLAPPEYAPTPIWGYDAGVPGPVIRVPQGGRLSRRLVNELPQPTTVHWHGIRIDNAMDGVPGITQDAVPAGASFDYAFDLPDAGTYWYHPHNRTWEQMARGLYGALIVEEPAPPGVDRDEVLLIDDWRFDADATIHESFGQPHDWAHGGRLGNWVTVNGDGAWQADVKRHERLRLRLVNTSNARIFSLDLKGLAGWVAALDGQPLEAPVVASDLVLAPAQRVDVIVDVTAEDGGEALITSRERDGSYAIASFPVRGKARSDALSQPKALAPNPIPALGDLDAAPVATLRMEGGAMGGMRGAMMGGQQMGPREMAAAGKFWSFNGMAEMPEAPFLQADRGQTIRIRMINDTSWPHAMHLHGHHFRQIGADGAVGPLRDTGLMQRGETTEIAFVADNPGDWLLHCHMLEHATSGMMTWLRVA